MKLSILIVNWNGLQDTKRCLASLQKSTFQDFDVNVWDNASSEDPTPIEEEFPDVRLLRSRDNLGYGPGNRAAAQLVTGELLLILNNDTVVPPDALATMVSIMDDDATIGVLGPVVRDLETGRVQNFGLRVTRHGQVRSLYADADTVPDGEWEATFVQGSALMIRHSLWRGIDGFDENHFLFGDDVDLCMRAWLAGARVVATSRATVLHAGHAAIGTQPKPQVIRWAKFADLRTFLKVLQARSLLRLVPGFIGYTALEVGKDLVVRRSISLARARCGAVADVAKGWRKLRRARRTTQRARAAPDARFLYLDASEENNAS